MEEEETGAGTQVRRTPAEAEIAEGKCPGHEILFRIPVFLSHI